MYLELVLIHVILNKFGIVVPGPTKSSDPTKQ